MKINHIKLSLICFLNADNRNWTNDLLFTKQLLYPWAIPAILKYWFFRIDLILLLNKFMSKIDPELKKKLLKESQAPFKGLRRILWIAFSGSAFLGLLIMLLKISNGSELQQNNLLIQLGACILFPTLLFLDRNKD